MRVRVRARRCTWVGVRARRCTRVGVRARRCTSVRVRRSSPRGHEGVGEAGGVAREAAEEGITLREEICRDHRVLKLVARVDDALRGGEGGG